MTTASRIRWLVDLLNNCRNEYYNNSDSPITDKEYDDYFDELAALEHDTGIILSNSPTQTVGYKVMTGLSEVRHEYPPMLSLDKTKELPKIIEFLDGKDAVVMAKMDGLTCRLTYEQGKIVRAETRGDGEVGEDVTHNISVVGNVPVNIPYTGKVVIDGEIICRKHRFEKLKEKFRDAKGKTYKNARNYAAGSIRLYDSRACSERGLEFIAWKFIEGATDFCMSNRFYEMSTLGFTTCPLVYLLGHEEPILNEGVNKIVDECASEGYPIDGCVFSFENCNYMESLGYTSHHSRAQMAYKFYDDKYDTVIRDIDWTMGKTGVLTPTAIFDTVEIDGTDVSRASLHNLTIMQSLNVRKDCSAKVFKANMIIPQVDSTEDDGIEDFKIPQFCPICGGHTMRVQENESEVLICSSPYCYGKLLGMLSAFVSKSGMDIDGLSEGKLQDLIDRKYIGVVYDLYSLHQYRDELIQLPGWGVTSVDNMLNAIAESRKVTPEHFLAALSIPNIGLTSAKTIMKHFNGNVREFKEALDNCYWWEHIEGFGEKTSQAINEWYHNNHTTFNILFNLMDFQEEEKPEVLYEGSPIAGKTFCITGTFEYHRSSIQKEIEAFGGICVPSVTKKTDVLFVGEKAGSKLKKAQELGIIIVTEDKYSDWLRGNVNA